MGGILTDKDGIDYKRNFSDWFRQNFKQYKIPPKGTIFDYYVIMDPEKCIRWYAFPAAPCPAGSASIPKPPGRKTGFPVIPRKTCWRK